MPDPLPEKRLEAMSRKSKENEDYALTIKMTAAKSICLMKERRTVQDKTEYQ